jgi:hypothetical protein
MIQVLSLLVTGQAPSMGRAASKTFLHAAVMGQAGKGAKNDEA